MKKYIGMQHIESIRYIDLHSNARCVIVTLLTYCTLFQQIFHNWDLTHIPFSFDTCPQLTIWKQLLFSWQECIWYSCLNRTYNSVVSVDGVPLVWVVSILIKVCVITYLLVVSSPTGLCAHNRLLLVSHFVGYLGCNKNIMKYNFAICSTNCFTSYSLHSAVQSFYLVKQHILHAWIY